MDLASIRIITDDIKRLVGFYEQVTELTATWYTPDFAELVSPSCTLAIGSTRTLAAFRSAIARPAENRSVILEFRSADVDKARERLKDVVTDLVQEPTTMPWGNRSLLFRDPDGNLVNLFTPVSDAAIRKFEATAKARSMVA